MKDSTILGLAFFGGIGITIIAISVFEYIKYRNNLRKLSEQTNKKTNL